MRSIPCEDAFCPDLPRQIQLLRLKHVMENELTALQRQALTAYYFEELSIAQIARNQGIHRSTALRTLRRAEARLRKYLRY